MGFGAWLFGKPTAQVRSEEWLRFILMQDRGTIPALMMEQMRREIQATVSRYAEIHDGCFDVKVDANTPGKGGKNR